ncbi:MAG: hypothetical protein ACO21J_09445 [Anaerohalosphaeraceae bacterium]|jgi:hypothetical protein
MKMKRLNIVLGLVFVLSLNCFAGLQRSGDISRQRPHWMHTASVFDTTGIEDDQFGWTSPIIAAPAFLSQMADADAQAQFPFEMSDDSSSMEFIGVRTTVFFDGWKSLLADILHTADFRKIK